VLLKANPACAALLALPALLPLLLLLLLPLSQLMHPARLQQWSHPQQHAKQHPQLLMPQQQYCRPATLEDQPPHLPLLLLPLFLLLLLAQHQS
jgi:hypothetical protein